VRFAKSKNVISEEGQVGRDDEIYALGRSGCRSLGSEHNFFYQGKIEERLTALKFNLNPGRRAFKCDFEGLRRGLLAHIEPRPISALARNLAVWAGMFATKCHDE
jgi:hypothetical protein